MSKDQAARIAEKALGDYEHDTSHLARSIRRAITSAVRKERERCVGIVHSKCNKDLSWLGSGIVRRTIIKAINGGKR